MGARQAPFDPRAGFVQLVPKIAAITCGECTRTLPPATCVCPFCGADRGLSGSAYPAQKVERFDWVFAQRIDSPTQRLVLLALVAHDMPGGQGIFPSIDRLATMTGLGRRAVIYALDGLRDAGWIERSKVRRRGRQGSNEYTIRQPELIVADAIQSARGAP